MNIGTINYDHNLDQFRIKSKKINEIVKNKIEYFERNKRFFNHYIDNSL